MVSKQLKVARDKNVPNAYIYGEYHSYTDRLRIELAIKKQHQEVPFTLLLAEEVGDGIFLNRREQLDGKTRNYTSFSTRSFDLAMELNIPLIGVDAWNDLLPDNFDQLNTAEQFSIREKRMLAVFRKYRPGKQIAMIVGDSHLRTTTTRFFGKPSILQTQLASDPLIVIDRSPKSEVK